MPLNPEPDSNSAPTQADLVARLNLMEAMIAEGRRATGRCGWIFVLWGLVDLAGMALQWEHPGRMWNWPAAISTGVVLQFIGFGLLGRSGRLCRPNVKGRALSAIWGMMGVTLVLYCFTAIFTHHTEGRAYLAAIFVIIGMAHATSAIILRWRVQGAVAALWWAGGLSLFFVPFTLHWFVGLFSIEMLFGMVFFGLYAMWLERRSSPPAVAAHA
jgi:hypothetical protein